MLAIKITNFQQYIWGNNFKEKEIVERWLIGLIYIVFVHCCVIVTFLLLLLLQINSYCQWILEINDLWSSYQTFRFAEFQTAGLTAA